MEQRKDKVFKIYLLFEKQAINGLLKVIGLQTKLHYL